MKKKGILVLSTFHIDGEIQWYRNNPGFKSWAQSPGFNSRPPNHRDSIPGPPKSPGLCPGLNHWGFNSRSCESPPDKVDFVSLLLSYFGRKNIETIQVCVTFNHFYLIFCEFLLCILFCVFSCLISCRNKPFVTAEMPLNI